MAQDIIESTTADAYDKSTANFICGYILRNSKKEESYLHYLESLHFAKISGRTDDRSNRRRASLLRNIGKKFRELKIFETSLEYFREGLNYADAELELDIKYDIAYAYKEDNNYSSAILYLNEILSKELNPADNIEAKNLLATTHAENGNYDEAKAILSTLIADSTNTSSYYLGRTYNNLGYTFLLEGDTITAIKNYEKALGLKEGKDKFNAASVLTRIYYHKGWLNESIAVGSLADRYYSERSPIADNYLFYYYLAASHQKNNDEARYDQFINRYSKEEKKYMAYKGALEDKSLGESLLIIKEKYDKKIKEEERRAQTIKLTLVGLFILFFIGFLVTRRYRFSFHFSFLHLRNFIRHQLTNIF